MILFNFPQHAALPLPDLRDTSEPVLGRCRFGRFPDGELWLEVDGSVADAVLGSLAPP